MLAVLLAALESDADRQKFIEIYEKYHVQMERTAMRRVMLRMRYKTHSCR